MLTFLGKLVEKRLRVIAAAGDQSYEYLHMHPYLLTCCIKPYSLLTLIEQAKA